VREGPVHGLVMPRRQDSGGVAGVVAQGGGEVDDRLHRYGAPAAAVQAADWSAAADRLGGGGVGESKPATMVTCSRCKQRNVHPFLNSGLTGVVAALVALAFKRPVCSSAPLRQRADCPPWRLHNGGVPALRPPATTGTSRCSPDVKRRHRRWRRRPQRRGTSRCAAGPGRGCHRWSMRARPGTGTP
jgi:hypothetical protein